MPKLLVVDDDEAGCRLLKAIFGPEGFEVLFAHDGRAGLERIRVDRPAAVLLDVQMPGLSGLEVLEALRSEPDAPPVVMLTAESGARMALKALRAGAQDYLVKPVDHEEVVLVVRKAIEARNLEAEVARLRRRLGEDGGLADRMGPSGAIRQLSEQVRAVAASDFTVLLLGETGTGKELVAQALHRESPRRARPFIAIDCGAIPEPLLESELFGHEPGAFTGASRRRKGHFELAQGGTFFLDEVGNLPMSLQAKLLRVLESRQVQPLGANRPRAMDVRFVAATNLDLQARASEGTFRADLYFRLAQYTLALPALRERVDDIPYLAQRFLGEASFELRRPVQQILPEALEALAAYRWPGNVRELRNVVRQAVLRADGTVLSRESVRALLKSAGPAPTHRLPTAGRSLKEVADEAARAAERLAIQDALRTSRGNKSQAARALRTDFKTLHVKMKQLGIRGRDFG